MVFVMWEARYKPFQKKLGEPTFKSINQAMRLRDGDKTGWAAIAGQSDWMFFKFSHTHPQKSNSGLMTLVLMAYDFFGKTDGLSGADLTRSDFQDFFESTETGIVAPIGTLVDSTGNLMDDMVRKGPSTYDVVFVYESVAIDRLRNAEGRWKDSLRVVYPKFNMWNDNPYYILDVPWSTPEQRKAAAVFLGYLTSPAVQAKAMDHGFRPANMNVPTNTADSPFVKYKDYGLKLDLGGGMCAPPKTERHRRLAQPMAGSAQDRGERGPRGSDFSCSERLPVLALWGSSPGNRRSRSTYLGFELPALSLLHAVRVPKQPAFRRLGRLPFQTQVLIRQLRRPAPLSGSGDEGVLKQERLDHVLERVAFLAHGGGDGFHANRATVVDLDHRFQVDAVLVIEAAVVDAGQLESGFCDRHGELAVAFHGGVVAHPAEEPVGDARRAAAPPGKLPQGLPLHVQLHELGVGQQDLVQGLGSVELDVLGDPEPAAHRAGEKADAGRGADQRERLDGDGHRPGVGALVDGDVHFEIFHRRVKVLLDDGAQPVDLIDEQQVAETELGEDADQVRAFGEGRAAGDVYLRAHLVGDDVGQGSLAEARGPCRSV